MLIRRSCSLFLGGDTRFTRPAAVLLLRRPGRVVLTGGGSTIGVPASIGRVLGVATGAVGCSGLTGTNLGSIWRSQTGHQARLSSIGGLSDDLHKVAPNKSQWGERDRNKHNRAPLSRECPGLTKQQEQDRKESGQAPPRIGRHSAVWYGVYGISKRRCSICCSIQYEEQKWLRRRRRERLPRHGARVKLSREALAGGVSWSPWAYTGSYHALVIAMQAVVTFLTW